MKNRIVVKGNADPCRIQPNVQYRAVEPPEQLVPDDHVPARVDQVLGPIRRRLNEPARKSPRVGLCKGFMVTVFLVVPSGRTNRAVSKKVSSNSGMSLVSI